MEFSSHAAHFQQYFERGGRSTQRPLQAAPMEDRFAAHYGNRFAGGTPSMASSVQFTPFTGSPSLHGRPVGLWAPPDPRAAGNSPNMAPLSTPQPVHGTRSRSVQPSGSRFASTPGRPESPVVSHTPVSAQSTARRLQFQAYGSFSERGSAGATSPSSWAERITLGRLQPS
eukprot:RCo027170